MNARGIDGADGRLGVGVSGEQDAARVRIELAGAFEQFDAAHAGHALVAEKEGNGLFSCFDLGKGVESGLPAGGAHHPVFSSIMAPEVLHNRFQDVHVIVYRQ